MVLFSFHYLVTTFFISIWVGCPHGFSWTMLIYFLTQMIYFLAGGDIGDGTLFWGWQTLVAFLGTLSGQILSQKSPRLLVYNSVYSWLYFVFSLAASLGAQLLYANFPPLSTVPSGQAGVGVTVTFILSFIIILAVWYGVSRVDSPPRLHFFKRWLFFTALMQLLFFITLSGLDELWVAIISGGSVVILGAISITMRPRKPRKRKHRMRI